MLVQAGFEVFRSLTGFSGNITRCQAGLTTNVQVCNKDMLTDFNYGVQA